MGMEKAAADVSAAAFSVGQDTSYPVLRKSPMDRTAAEGKLSLVRPAAGEEFRKAKF